MVLQTPPVFYGGVVTDRWIRGRLSEPRWFVDSLGALMEEGFFFFIEVELNNLFDTVAADDGGNTDAKVAFAIFAVKQG